MSTEIGVLLVGNEAWRGLKIERLTALAEGVTRGDYVPLEAEHVSDSYREVWNASLAPLRDAEIEVVHADWLHLSELEVRLKPVTCVLADLSSSHLWDERRETLTASVEQLQASTQTVVVVESHAGLDEIDRENLGDIWKFHEARGMPCFYPCFIYSVENLMLAAARLLKETNDGERTEPDEA